MTRLGSSDLHISSFLIILCVICTFATVGQASIFYTSHTIPVPRYRSYYDSVGEQKLTNNRYEASVIVQGDILLTKQCECIPRYQCRSPRNIVNLKTRDCHHHGKVCCEN
ncbi:uncharacterized protein LOC131439662 [Malaya genurostris]|uniref:uncharacterized protein LOC131439662 n=1 Tax=Malaya genurostris TaxID=325434 RepID=UPI0026F3A526|nr:uncharacterized protein LOC131439662 [Malaya genurostris]